MKIANGLDFNKTQILNAQIHNLGSAPGSPVAGQFWYNTGDNYIYYWNGTVNTQVCTAAQLLATRLNQLTAPNASVDMGGQRAINQADPISPQDSATKAYVDALVQGLKWKDAVRVGTTANITLSGTQTIDSISVIVGDRVAVMNQSSGGQNGIYLVASGAWTRTTDADTAAEVLGMTFFVSEGTVNGNKIYSMTTDAPITLGTTSLVFVTIGGGTSYTAGTGISIGGSVISVDTAVTARKVVAQIGNGSLTSISVTHSLGTKAVSVGLRKVSTDEHWIPDVTSTSTSAVTLNFATAPATNELEVVIIG